MGLFKNIDLSGFSILELRVLIGKANDELCMREREAYWARREKESGPVKTWQPPSWGVEGKPK